MNWFFNLKKMKENSTLSTREIAALSGIPEPTLEKIFAGQTKSPGINTIQSIVHAMGGTLDDLDPATIEKENSKILRVDFGAKKAPPKEEQRKFIQFPPIP